MTRGRLSLIVLGLLGLAAALAVLAWAGLAAVPAPPQAAPVVVVVTTSPEKTVARPAATTAPPTTAPPPPPEPFVQDFARQPRAKPLKPLPSPTATLKIPVNIDGCDHAYGAATQCIPWTFPAGTTDKCAWLAEHGYVEVKVLGRDRQGLDPDGNGVACDG